MLSNAVDDALAPRDARIDAANVLEKQDRYHCEPNLVSGRYIDKLERRNGELRIAVREFRILR